MIYGEQIECDFPDGSGKCLRAIRIGQLSLPDHASCALIGPSGSGKSTLFRCISGILRPTSGRITVDGTEVTALSTDEAAHWRAEHVGFIFQQALLFPYLTVMENILLASDIAGKDRAVKKREAEEWLTRLGMEGFGRRMPSRLSGGEKQRAGFIRAILTEPQLLLADEPTASLDRENSCLIMDCLLDYQRRSGCTLLCATHDPAVQARFGRKICLNKGEAVS